MIRFFARAFHIFFGVGDSCRFQPTCSQYFSSAYEIHGFMLGTFYSLRRICRCHPWGSLGLDPVPKVHRKVKS